MADRVRTRFAPSPTGYMHVGNLRTALYAYLIAKKNKGDFILRIEDTDKERFVEGAVEIIYDTLKSTGLIHDEGPDIGGPRGPYIQSQRRSIYSEYADMLLKTGGAYRCFCDKTRLDELRSIHEASRVPHKYDGYCSRLSPEKIEQYLNENRPFVIRQSIPAGKTAFDDEVFGHIEVENDTLDDNVLIKSDGLPTYNFANVIDDHLMGITHVVRGSEYLASTPKYNLLYAAFGWQPPKYIHCPPVMKDSARKLSKRDGDASYQDLIEKGYLKEAVLNYIALLGWSPGGEKEKFSLLELVDVFSIENINKAPAIFDAAKLTWLNGEYLRAMPLDIFYGHAKPFLEKTVTRKDIDLTVLSALLQPRCEKLTDIPEQVDFFDSLPEYDTILYENKKMKTDKAGSLTVLKNILKVLEGLPEWTESSIHKALFDLIGDMGVKNGYVLWPLRVALSGKQFTPGGALEIAFLLGKEDTLFRIQKGIFLLENI